LSTPFEALAVLLRGLASESAREGLSCFYAKIQKPAFRGRE